MIDRVFAEQFAAEWIEAWNAHDLGRILSHYTDDFEMTSPAIVRIGNEPSGVLKGKAQVGAYWAKAFDLVPDLHFELFTVLVGVASVTVYYRGPLGLGAEVFHFDDAGRVARSYAHYAPDPSA